MSTHSLTRRLAVLLLLTVSAGCVASGDAVSDDEEAVEVTGEESLMAFLIDEGHLLAADGLARISVPTTTSRQYRLEGAAGDGRIAVYEFANDADARRGLQILRREIRDRTDRSLFVRGRMMVLYQGNDPGLRFSLRRALGAPRSF